MVTRSVRLAKAKVAGSNPVFRSNYKGPALLWNLQGPGPFFLGFRQCLDLWLAKTRLSENSWRFSDGGDSRRPHAPLRFGALRLLARCALLSN